MHRSAALVALLAGAAATLATPPAAPRLVDTEGRIDATAEPVRST